MNMKLSSFYILFLIGIISLVEGSKILGFFTSQSKSHVIVHTSLVRGLAAKGHDVTVVTTIPIKLHPKIRHIQLDVAGISREYVKENMYKELNGFQKFRHFLEFAELLTQHANATLNHPSMRKLMAEESFDLVILGYFMNDFLLGVAAHFECPVVISWMGPPMSFLNKMVGNPSEISYVPHGIIQARQPMDFSKRIVNFFVNIFDVVFSFYMDQMHSKYYLSNFSPHKYPSLNEIKKNVSLIFCNHHFSQTPIAPLVPAVIQVGGIQIKEKPDPLPEDLKTILDGATKHGAIYFSLGSNAYSSDLAEDKIKMIYSVLSNLKQTVIWKWEEGEPPGKAANIIFKKWLPQDDILAHPNVKLFISHGGKGSVVEAEYHGVPIVGLPLFAEQDVNVHAVEAAGKGIALNYYSLKIEEFKDAVEEVLNNPKYRDATQRASKLFRDRPMTALETATFWLEYVLRHNGAPHIQSPAVHMNFFQYHSLDVLAVILIAAYLVLKVLKIVFKSICVLCSKKKKSQSKKQNKKQKEN